MRTGAACDGGDNDLVGSGESEGSKSSRERFVIVFVRLERM